MESYKLSQFPTINIASQAIPNSIYLNSSLIKALPTARKTWKILSNIPARLNVYKVYDGKLYFKNSIKFDDPMEICMFTFFSAIELGHFERAIMDEMDEYLKTIESEPVLVENEIEPFETETSTLIKRK